VNRATRIAPLPEREIRSAAKKRTLSAINHASVRRAFYRNVIIIIAAMLYLEGVSRGKQIGHDHYHPSRSLGSRVSWLLAAAAAAAAAEHPCLLYAPHACESCTKDAPSISVCIWENLCSLHARLTTAVCRVGASFAYNLIINDCIVHDFILIKIDN